MDCLLRRRLARRQASQGSQRLMQQGHPKPTLQREAQRLVGAGILQDRTLGRARLLRANLSNRAAVPLTQLLQVIFGPETVIGEEFDLANAEQVLIYGSWADRYHGTPGPQPNDVDVLVVGSLDRADVYDTADRAQTRLGRAPLRQQAR